MSDMPVFRLDWPETELEYWRVFNETSLRIKNLEEFAEKIPAEEKPDFEHTARKVRAVGALLQVKLQKEISEKFGVTWDLPMSSLVPVGMPPAPLGKKYFTDWCEEMKALDKNDTSQG